MSSLTTPNGFIQLKGNTQQWRRKASWLGFGNLSVKNVWNTILKHLLQYGPKYAFQYMLSCINFSLRLPLLNSSRDLLLQFTLMKIWKTNNNSIMPYNIDSFVWCRYPALQGKWVSLWFTTMYLYPLALWWW